MGNIDNLVEGMRTNLKKQRPRNHPVEGHPIAETDEYVRKMYFDMLCVIAQYANDNTEKRLAFVERIHTGAGLKNEFSEHIKDSMNITPDKLDEFFKQCKENDLTVNFIIDGLLIACVDGKPNSKQMEFAAEMAEALGLTKEEVELLSKLAIAILEQDNDKYFAAMENAPEKSTEKIVRGVFCYIKEFVSGVLVDNEDLLWIYSKNQTQYRTYDYCIHSIKDKEKRYDLTDHNKVVLYNLELVSDDRNHIYFRENDVIIKNCIFKSTLGFSDNTNITIENCKFNDIDCGGCECLSFGGSGIKNVSISACEFSNMCFNSIHQLIFWAPDADTCTIEKTTFKNIKAEGGIRGVIASLGGITQGKIKDCSFISCQGSKLFYLCGDANLSLENNTYKNCCKVTNRD